MIYTFEHMEEQQEYMGTNIQLLLKKQWRVIPICLTRKMLNIYSNKGGAMPPILN